ncbi:MAG: CRTAC1 family protein [Acidobacteriota bacterium]
MSHLGRSAAPLWIAASLLGACSSGDPAATGAPTQPTEAALFVDKTPDELDFLHDSGARGRYYYPEMMQGGAGLFDADGDGRLDLYLVQSGALPPAGDAGAMNRLYRNLGDWQFEDVTGTSGVGDRGYGSGLAVGDIDGDGWNDLYVTNLGPNRLYRNRRDGTFEDVTQQWRTDDPGYSTCAAFFDMDADGDQDLYVCNYVEWSVEVEKRCLGFHGAQGYCGPHEYRPARDTLFRNDGDRFTDVTAESGLASVSSATLGLAVADFDDDGDLDLYTANDQMANHLFVNRGDGRFVDEGLERGVAFNQEGYPEAGMGVFAEDIDEDGDWDLFVTHLSKETNTLYRNDGGLFFDATQGAGLGAVSQAYTGFGVGLFDFDGDGRRDLLIAHGKVSHGDDLADDFSEPDQLLQGQADGRFAAAPLDLPRRVTRALAFGDLDDDGATDVLLQHNGAAPKLLASRPTGGSWLGVHVRRRAGGGLRDTVLQARVTLTLEDGRKLYRRVETSSSYAAANDPRALFRLTSGDRPKVLQVRGPNGTAQVDAPVLGRYLSISLED